MLRIAQPRAERCGHLALSHLPALWDLGLWLLPAAVRCVRAGVIQVPV